MAKSRVSTIIDQIIDDIEIQLERDSKHVIKVDTIKDRASEFITIDCNNDDSQRCAEIGFDQVVHNRLYQYGYRSIRMGLFINLDSCDNVQRLRELLNSADSSLQDKQKIWMKIKKQLDGQIEMQFDGSEHTGYVETMTEEEFIDDLLADAI